MAQRRIKYINGKQIAMVISELGFLKSSLIIWNQLNLVTTGFGKQFIAPTCCNLKIGLRSEQMTYKECG